MRSLLQDLRYGGRIITTQPGYSLLIVLTLAVAIGAYTVIFSFANILVLRPLTVKDPLLQHGLPLQSRFRSVLPSE
jgi:hypothetical protein